MLSKSRAFVSLGALVATATLAQAQSGFKSFGPPNEWGFPTYYTDHQDLPLAHCWDQADPLCGIDEILPLPLVISSDPAQGNFHHETFYWWANAILTIPGRGDAELVQALEGVFGNADEAVIDGSQTVFSRLRIRLRGDAFEAGFYRIHTPYGIFEFDAPAVEPGRRIINHTIDCLHVALPTPPPPTAICGAAPFGPDANFFTTPLGVLDDGTIAPQFAPNGPHFLIWDPTVAPAAPAGYVGDPRVLHPVIGAVAPNQNEFRVQFSRTPGGPIVFDERTNLFSVLGKIQPLGACDLVTPVADFGADPLSGTAPLTVNFSDLSTCATEWQWSFGDGGSSSAQSPSHVYTAPGVYTVSLTATGPGGSDVITRNGLITVTPVVEPPGDGLVLNAPVPGTAGVPNTYVVTGCSPGRLVGVYTGLVLGSSSLNLGSCGGIPIGLGRPFRLVGRAAANGAGVASVVATPPNNSGGKVFHFQAVEPFSCRTSNIVSDQL